MNCCCDIAGNFFSHFFLVYCCISVAFLKVPAISIEIFSLSIKNERCNIRYTYDPEINKYNRNFWQKLCLRHT